MSPNSMTTGTSSYQSGTLKGRLAAGEVVLNGWMSLSDPFVAEILASQGWASVTTDRQHGRTGPGGLWELALAISARGSAPLIRVPGLDDVEVAAALDAGFEGVICPMIETKEAAEHLVAACRYPPHGVRSFGPTRAALGFDGDFRERSNRDVLCLAMVETQKALDNLAAIVSVPGLDGVYVGPADLAISRGGNPILDDRSPGTVELLAGIAVTAREAGKFAGIHCASLAYAELMASKGFHLLTVGSDVRFLRTVGENLNADWAGRQSGTTGA